jgi:hypothetical protein
MQPVFFLKFQRRLKQVAEVKVDGRTHQQGMLKGHVKQKIAAPQASKPIIPAGKTQHPGADVQHAEKEKKGQPFIRCPAVFYAFAQEQKSIYQTVYKKNKQQSAVAAEIKRHVVKIGRKRMAGYLRHSHLPLFNLWQWNAAD